MNHPTKLSWRVFAPLALITPLLLPAAVDKIAPVISIRAEPFEPREVKLLDGPFKHAMELDAKWLLSLEPDRLLSWYRKEAGLEPKAKNYGGWEEMGIAGHSLGHYLSACARMYQDTGDANFRRRVDYIVAELAECQQANTNGFVGAMPNGKRVFDEVSRGEIRSAGFDLNGSWVPWYTQHKLLAGLLDARRFCDNTQALIVATQLGDWAIETTRNLTDEQWQKMLGCEHGGMNEVMAELYAVTGETKYLDLAKKFYHRAILDPMAEGRDVLPGKHANTQIPKMIGAARIYELTGDAKFAAIARNFFEIVLTNHTYVTGGNSDGEHFGPSGKLSNRLGQNTTETCNTYNMLKLDRALFRREPSARLADYYERALFNHILASQNPEDGRVLYYLTLRPGQQKHFLGEHDFTCCSGSGMENHARYGENIYFHGTNELWVNQFIASELNWAEQGVRVRQETSFPAAASTKLTISVSRPVKFALHLRHPFWATNGFTIKLNGRKLNSTSAPQSFITLESTWKNGDTVEIEMPFSLRVEAMPDNPNRIAIFYGPTLLAGDVGPADARANVPVLLTENRPVADWVKPVADVPLRFRTVGVGRPSDVELKPFFATYAHRHTVFFDRFTEAQWQERQAQYQAELARLKELEERTVDSFQPGEMQPERDHNVQGDKSGVGEHQGRKLRHAWDGGWFSFEVAVPTNAPADLVISYWGSETGKREFDVLVDGEKIATTSLRQDKPEEFWDKVYPLPESLTRDKSRVTVKFQAKPGNYAGGIFGVRVVKRK
ncbi:MAG: glycosyl hydrolase [Verrucomicrobia bacterium]|nr:MAG: glycosyl hydrolase [Verrucomicrobiota bacterium]